MKEIPVWPSYSIGPRDSIFALGVASIKFAELESILTFMFGTVFEIGRDEATAISAKIGSQACMQLVSQRADKKIVAG